MLCLNKFWVQKEYFVQKNFWSKKNVGPKVLFYNFENYFPTINTRRKVGSKKNFGRRKYGCVHSAAPEAAPFTAFRSVTT